MACHASSGVNGPQDTGASGARDAWQARCLAVHGFESQPSKGGCFHLERWQAQHLTVQDRHVRDMRLDLTYQFAVQCTTAAHNQLARIRGITQDVLAAGIGRVSAEGGLYIGRFEIFKQSQILQEPGGVEQVAPSALGWLLVQKTFIGHF